MAWEQLAVASCLSILDSGYHLAVIYGRCNGTKVADGFHTAYGKILATIWILYGILKGI